MRWLSLGAVLAAAALLAVALGLLFGGGAPAVATDAVSQAGLALTVLAVPLLVAAVWWHVAYG
jgi:hypothetical protein